MATIDPAISDLLFSDESAHSAQSRAGLALAWLARCQTGFSFALWLVPEAAEVRLQHGACKKCADEVRWIGKDRCSRCGARVGIGRESRRLLATRTRRALWRGVSCNTSRLAGCGTLFGCTGRDSCRESAGARDGDVRLTDFLTSVRRRWLCPCRSRRSLFERGFNQSELLGYWITRELKLKLETRLPKNRETRLGFFIGGKAGRI
jgi:hypothetical protein